MSDLPTPASDAAALMMVLLSEGGLRIDTPDAEGVPAVRTLLQADGNVVLFVREDCLTAKAILDRHFGELDRQIGILLGAARKVEGRFAMLSWSIRILYGGSGIASVASTIASILAGEVHFVWLGVSLIPLGLGYGLRRAPSAWLARRTVMFAQAHTVGRRGSR